MIPLTYQDSAGLTPWDRIRAANELVERASLDAPIRKLAAQILSPAKNVLVQGPELVARWVRNNVQYQRESPGTEILQGPYTTLWSGVGDCDDLGILWATLCRSAGIEARAAGVFSRQDPEELVHCVGYCEDTDQHYELSDDRRYGNPTPTRVKFARPSGYGTVFWSGSDDAYFVDHGDGYQERGSEMYGYGYMRAPKQVTPPKYGTTQPLPVTGDWNWGSDVVGGVRDVLVAAVGPGGLVGGQAPPGTVATYQGEGGEGAYVVPEQTSTFPTALVIGGLAAAGLVAYLLMRK